MGAVIFFPTLSLVLESDASNMGLDEQDKTGGLCMENKINYKGLLAIFMALKAFAKELSHCIILFLPVRQCHSRVLPGGAHSEVICNLVLEIWEWWLAQEIMVSAESP